MPQDIRPQGYFPQGSFIVPTTAIERRRRLAQELAKTGGSGPVQSWTQGAARLAGALGSVLEEGRANQMEQQRSSALAEAMRSGNPDAMIRSGEPELQQVGQFLFQRQQQEAQATHQAQVDAYNREKDARDFDLRRRKTEYDMQPGFTAMTPERQGQFPNAIGFDRDGKPVYPPAAGTTVNVGGPESADAEYYKKSAAQEAEAHGKISNQGLVASGLSQELEVLGELLKMSPSGPIAGGIAQRFPQISTAGAAATATIKRVAPSLRTPGTGSQSDIEYEGFLQSFPRLANTPEANELIIATMQNKAGVDMERAGIVDQIRNRQIAPQEGRMKLGELNKRSIMPEGLKAMMGTAQGADDGAPAPQGGGLPFEPDPRFPRITPEVWSTWPIEKQQQWKRMK